MATPNGKVSMHFKTVAPVDIPQVRRGKHRLIVSSILRDLDQLKGGAALEVPLADMSKTKENVRSALNRATRKDRRNIATATDASFLNISPNAGK